MNRLTKDLNTPHNDTTYADVVKDAIDRESIVLTKLKEYEDIEERFEIEILTLVKACDDGIYFKSLKGDIKFFDDVIVDFAHDLLICNVFDFDNHFEISIQDYGKAWALTRKELEKGE